LFRIKYPAAGSLHNAPRQKEDFHMPKDRNLLIVIADGEHVRYVRPAEDNALHTESVIDSFEAHKQSSDLESDHSGSSYHTGSSAHHALAPRHDPHALAKEKFAHTIARQLNAREAAGLFDELVIVATTHVLEAIRAALNTAAGAKVIGTLQKDLVKTPDAELWPHVRTWARPVHRVVM
jgi:protein required for attachment to host cells